MFQRLSGTIELTAFPFGSAPTVVRLSAGSGHVDCSDDQLSTSGMAEQCVEDASDTSIAGVVDYPILIRKQLSAHIAEVKQ